MNHRACWMWIVFSGRHGKRETFTTSPVNRVRVEINQNALPRAQFNFASLDIQSRADFSREKRISMVPAWFFERKNRKCDFLQAKLSAATNRQMHEASRTFDIPRLYSAWGKRNSAPWMIICKLWMESLMKLKQNSVCLVAVEHEFSRLLRLRLRSWLSH